MSISHNRIGVLIIGQTPRTDLTAPLAHLSDRCELMVRGALDSYQHIDVPITSNGTYPLVTRLRDGTHVTVDENFLTPLLQAAIDDLEQAGVTSILLLCAGPFLGLVSSRPLIRPFQLGTLVLQSLGLRRIAVIVPTNDQCSPAQVKWEEVGLEPVLISMEEKPSEQPLEDWITERIKALPELAALVLDYVGHPAGLVSELQSRMHLPVIDLGQLSGKVIEAILISRTVPAPSSKGANA